MTEKEAFEKALKLSVAFKNKGLKKYDIFFSLIAFKLLNAKNDVAVKKQFENAILQGQQIFNNI